MSKDLGTQEKFVYGNDPIVIRKYVDGLKGGVILDTTGFPDEFIKGGHVIIRDTATQEVYKPMPVSSGAYSSLPTGYEYVGICVATVPAAEPFCGVLTIGEVNDKALPYEITSIKAAFKAAVPTIVFNHD